MGLQVGLLEGLWDTKLASWSAWGLQVGSQGLQVELLKALWAAKGASLGVQDASKSAQNLLNASQEPPQRDQDDSKKHSEALLALC